MSVEIRHIAIDVRLDADGISGRAGDGSDQVKSFEGWLGLLQVLDALLDTTVEEPGALRRGETSWNSASGNASPA
jgi:hypothetical protein